VLILLSFCRSKKPDPAGAQDAPPPHKGLDAATAREEVEDENDDGENEKDVNPAADRISANKAKYPKNYKNNRDRPKHKFGLLASTVL
jgi:hypothetical protein